MELNLFKKNLTKCAKLKNKIFILGRGFSTSLFLKKIKHFKKNNLIIGFNTDEIIDELDFYFTNKNKIPRTVSKKKLLEFKKIFNLYKEEIKIYKVGSINYSIDSLLYLINKNLDKIKIPSPIEVIFLGFDFRTSLPEGDYKIKRRKNINQSHIDISGQRDLFFKRKNAYKNLKIFHAGFDLYSDFDPRGNFSKKKIKKETFKTKIVAEITTNHHGETNNIIELINGAKIAGADYVKFQMRDVESFYPKKLLA